MRKRKESKMAPRVVLVNDPAGGPPRLKRVSKSYRLAAEPAPIPPDAQRFIAEYTGPNRGNVEKSAEAAAIPVARARKLLTQAKVLGAINAIIAADHRPAIQDKDLDGMLAWLRGAAKFDQAQIWESDPAAPGELRLKDLAQMAAEGTTRYIQEIEVRRTPSGALKTFRIRAFNTLGVIKTYRDIMRDLTGGTLKAKNINIKIIMDGKEHRPDDPIVVGANTQGP